jgi:hypothetical protein
LKRHTLLQKESYPSTALGGVRAASAILLSVIAVTTRSSKQGKSAYMTHDVNVCIAKRALFGFKFR